MQRARLLGSVACPGTQPTPPDVITPQGCFSWHWDTEKGRKVQVSCWGTGGKTGVAETAASRSARHSRYPKASKASVTLKLVTKVGAVQAIKAPFSSLTTWDVGGAADLVERLAPDLPLVSQFQDIVECCGERRVTSHRLPSGERLCQLSLKIEWFSKPGSYEYPSEVPGPLVFLAEDDAGHTFEARQ